ncbi:MAG: flagellar hook-length control protein FliK [Nitrosomonadales bacterium]|nr:flagellar hook-length control protein FliK [Nitrosomonadales bacterium]
MSPSISQIAAGKQVQKSALPAFANTASAEGTPLFGDILAMQLGNASAATTGKVADVLPTENPTAQFGDAISAKLPAFRPESLQARSNAASVAAHLTSAHRANAARAERTELAVAAPQNAPIIGTQIAAADNTATTRKSATAADVSDTRPSAGDTAATAPTGATPADIAAMMSTQTIGQTAPARAPEKVGRPTEQTAADSKPLPTVGQVQRDDKAQDRMVRAATAALARDPAFAAALNSASKQAESAAVPGRSAPDSTATAQTTIAQTGGVIAKQVRSASDSEVRPVRNGSQTGLGTKSSLIPADQPSAADAAAPTSSFAAPVNSGQGIAMATPSPDHGTVLNTPPRTSDSEVRRSDRNDRPEQATLTTSAQASDNEARPVRNSGQSVLREPSTLTSSDQTSPTEAAASALASSFAAPTNAGRSVATATPVSGKEAVLNTTSQTSGSEIRPTRSNTQEQRSERSATSPSLQDAGQKTAPAAFRNADFVAALGSASKQAESVSAAAKPAADATPVTTNPAGFSALTPTQSVTQPALATVSTPFAQPAWTDDFNQKVTWVATQNLQSAELHLNPPQLGPLDVVINVNGDQATAQFSSPHAAVREAIEQAMPKLREMMADNGITLGNTTVSDQGRQGNQDANSSRQQPTPSTMREVSDNMEAGVQQSIQTTPARRQNGLLDTFA